MMLKLFSLALILASTLSLTACNTVQGAAEDVEAGASAISDSARDNKNY